ncbi:MAG: class I SAM-dependent methyltransferase [Planctomycetota bacterium]
MNSRPDPYSRLDYRRLIAWPRRITREWPLLEAIISSGPSRRLLDLGCGTGEHARFIASKGFEVVAVDMSASMIEKATDKPVPENLRFVHGDMRELQEVIDGSFGAAICLGNTLPHLWEKQDLRRLLKGLNSRLLPGAPFLLQILNYERILSTGERSLPMNFRPDPEGDGELVFLRLMEPCEDGKVIFCPTTLRYRPSCDPPVELHHSRRVELRGWRRADLKPLLRAAGFHDLVWHGCFDGMPYEPLESHDLIVIAR